MEYLNKFIPKRLSAEAYDFILFYDSLKQELNDNNVKNTAAYIMKKYNKPIKASRARDWVNTYDVIDGFVYRVTDFDKIKNELESHGFTLFNINYSVWTIKTKEEAEHLESLKPKPNIRVFKLENVIVDPTLKKEYKKINELMN